MVKKFNLKHTIWGLVSAVFILLIGFGVLFFLDLESSFLLGFGVFITILLAMIPIYTVLFGTNKEDLFISGIPLKPGMKVIITSIFLVLLILNNILPGLFISLDYSGKVGVSLAFIGLMILFSIGSIAAETIMIAFFVLVIFSSGYDLVVRDFSQLRRNILVLSFAVLAISLTLGKVSFLNLLAIMKNQMGAGGKLNR